MDSLAAFATLVSTGHYLRKIISEDQEKTTKHNILFALFNGESYDYIGSQRFVYDLQNKAFPDKASRRNLISLDNIDLLIDIGTLDNPNNLIIYHAKELKQTPLVS